MSASLDIENHGSLLEYLRASNEIARDESPGFETLTGGVSNRVVRVERPSGESWVIKQALSKLRTKADWFSDPARVHREALGIRWLSRLAPEGTITPLVFEDFEHHLIAMQAVPKPHENWKTMLLAGRVTMAHVEQFAAILGAIHRHSAESKEPLSTIFDDRSFFESLRLEPYYAYTASQLPQAADFLGELICQTRQRRLALVHGDFSPKNILVYDGRLALLDHEVIHWGDPAFDLGFALTHFLAKLHHLRRPQFARAAVQFCEIYAAAVGPVYWNDNLQAMAVRHAVGCLLARVAGRSPLEYLNDAERDSIRDVTVSMTRHVPITVEQLIAAFVLGTGPYGTD